MLKSLTFFKSEKLEKKNFARNDFGRAILPKFINCDTRIFLQVHKHCGKKKDAFGCEGSSVNNEVTGTLATARKYEGVILATVVLLNHIFIP